jgi:hypothetical protein
MNCAVASACERAGGANTVRNAKRPRLELRLGRGSIGASSAYFAGVFLPAGLFLSGGGSGFGRSDGGSSWPILSLAASGP